MADHNAPTATVFSADAAGFLSFHMADDIRASLARHFDVPTEAVLAKAERDEAASKPGEGAYRLTIEVVLPWGA